MGCSCKENKNGSFSDPEVTQLCWATLEEIRGGGGQPDHHRSARPRAVRISAGGFAEAYLRSAPGVKTRQGAGCGHVYTQFRTKPVGQNLILLSGYGLPSTARPPLKKRLWNIWAWVITPDGLFTHNNVACLGCCSLSPVMMVGEETYMAMTKAKVGKIHSGHRSKGDQLDESESLGR